MMVQGYDGKSDMICAHTWLLYNLVTQSQFGTLVTSSHLWLVAMSCSHVIMVCNLFCHFLANECPLGKLDCHKNCCKIGSDLIFNRNDLWQKFQSQLWSGLRTICNHLWRNMQWSHHFSELLQFTLQVKLRRWEIFSREQKNNTYV